MPKKDKYWFIPWIAVAIGALIFGAIGRSLALNHSGDKGTANLTFFIVVVSAVFLYIVFVALWDSVHQAIKRKKRPAEVVEQVDSDEGVIQPPQKQEVEPKVDIEKIKRDADTQYLERRKTKINLFKKYAHIAVGPYITADELQRLDEYIEYYANEESLPDNLKSINPEKLSNPDIFHFGWNMAHYFNKKKQEVAPWLMKVFTPLSELELSYVVGKLHDPQTRKFIIPNIDDIPKYITEIEV